MKVFVLVWIAQLASKIGAGLAIFVLGIWLYQLTGSVTKFALMYMFTALPPILLSPLAGALGDRFNRRSALMMSEGLAALSMSILALVMHAGLLRIWFIYAVVVIMSVCGTVKWQALSAATPLLVKASDLGRASGMLQFSEASASIVSPLIGGILLGAVAPYSIIAVVVATSFFAMLVLLKVSIPKSRSVLQTDGLRGIRLLWHEIVFGWNYIAARPGLLSLLIYFSVTNFLTGVFALLVTPFILGIASAHTLGFIQSFGGFGMLAGSVLMTAWGGPKLRINGIFGFMLLTGTSMVLAGMQPSIRWVGLANFIILFSLPFVISSSQAIWQTKVPPSAQGKVFGIRRMITQLSFPFAYLLVGPITDRLASGASRGGVPTLSTLNGIPLIMMVTGVLLTASTIGGYLYPTIRLLERNLADALNEDKL